MKNIILLIAVVIVVGCGEDKQTTKELPKETPSNITNPPKGTLVKPPKELTLEEQKALREKVAGDYERKEDEYACDNDDCGSFWVLGTDFEQIQSIKAHNLKCIEDGCNGKVTHSLNTYKWVLAGKKNTGEIKWSISKNGEIHIEDGEIINQLEFNTLEVLWEGYKKVSRINKDGSLTFIAWIDKGEKRRDLPKEDQLTYKKIK